MASNRGRHRSPKRSAGYQLLRRGLSDSAIAERLGVSRTTVARWRAELGIAPLSRADNQPRAAPSTSKRSATPRARPPREPRHYEADPLRTIAAGGGSPASIAVGLVELASVFRDGPKPERAEPTREGGFLQLGGPYVPNDGGRFCQTPAAVGVRCQVAPCGHYASVQRPDIGASITCSVCGRPASVAVLA
jgi:hypothetical protein